MSAVNGLVRETFASDPQVVIDSETLDPMLLGDVATDSLEEGDARTVGFRRPGASGHVARALAIEMDRVLLLEARRSSTRRPAFLWRSDFCCFIGLFPVSEQGWSRTVVRDWSLRFLGCLVVLVPGDEAPTSGLVLGCGISAVQLRALEGEEERRRRKQEEESTGCGKLPGEGAQ